MSTLHDNENHYQHEDDDIFTPSTHPDEAFSLVYGNEASENVWILIGLDDANAAAACQPTDVAIYALDKRELAALPDDLEVVDDKKVLIFPHGDAATEHHVYDQLAKLGTHCDEEGAHEVKFLTLSTRLTSYLGDRDPSKQAKRLERLVNSRVANKPSKLKPKALSPAQLEKKAQMEVMEREATEKKRPLVDINEDRYAVLNNLVDALRKGVHGDRIFNLGGKLACTTRDHSGETVAELLGESALLVLMADSAHTVSVTTRGVNAAWPESKTISALYGRYSDFRELRGVAPSPIVRSDNTIAQTEGYDEQSKVLLDLAGLSFNIPDAPTQDDVDEAVNLLLNEWLGDFPFASDADKANALAFVLTYPLRELVTNVPLAVISAKSMGTGKSKLLGLVVRLFTRTTPEWDSLPDSEEETRKQITTLLSKAAPFLCFDECPKIGGKSLNRLLTAQTWSDRLLGGNERVALPNRSVMAATGNNVQVLGDTGRRYYPIELYYDGEHPESRPESDFQHPDVEAWTDENRGELLSAVFTLIRAWQVAGRPKRATSFGSFERWEGVVGGVLYNAGVKGFLDNLSDHRKSADYDEGLWIAHCEWLSTKFPIGRFSSRDVVNQMVEKVGKAPSVNPAAELPPGIDTSPLDPGYTAKLGKLYKSRDGGTFGGYRLSKFDGKTGNAARWSLKVSDSILQERASAAAAEAAVQARLQKSHPEKFWPPSVMADLVGDIDAPGTNGASAS